MLVNFQKYQGTGNDFIMLDNRTGEFDTLTIEQIQFLCDRRFGIGADGLIRINMHPTYAFEVDYSNSDGSKSFCGNGARCAVAFADTLGIPCENVTFLAIDGEHEAKMTGELIAIQMQNVLEIHEIGKDYVLQTGSPHYVRFTEVLKEHDVVAFGKEIRYSEPYKIEGINVNLAHQDGDKLFVETYERGVEDETLSCGTGVTAAAIAAAYRVEQNSEQQVFGADNGGNFAVTEISPVITPYHFDIEVKGGALHVSFQHEPPSSYTNIWLTGPAAISFKGEINV